MQNQQTGALEIQFQLRPSFSAPEPRRPCTPAAVESGKLPRITQVLALAIQFEEMVRTGEAKDYADLARLGCVTRERISQIMKLRWLAPDIQAKVLRLPRTPSGRFPICEAKLRKIADEIRWPEQHRMWRVLHSALDAWQPSVASPPGFTSLDLLSHDLPIGCPPDERVLGEAGLQPAFPRPSRDRVIGRPG